MTRTHATHRSLGTRLLSGACALALACGLAPVPAHAAAHAAAQAGARAQAAAAGDPAGGMQVEALQQRAVRLARIAAHEGTGAFADDSIIVMYKDAFAAPSGQPAAPSDQPAAPSCHPERSEGSPTVQSAEGWSAGDSSPLAQNDGNDETWNGGNATDAMPATGELAPYQVADVPQGMSVAAAVAQAEADPQVAYAQPNYRYYLEEDAGAAPSAPDVPNAADAFGGHGAPDALAAAELAAQAGVPVDDPAAQVQRRSSTMPNQWWLYSIGAFDAWGIARAEGQVSVAVLDTGFNFDHEDLKNVLDARYAYDIVADAPLTASAKSQDYAHGCHVAGIVAGEADNGVGIAGVSYNANVVPIAVFYDYYDEEDMQNYAITSDENLMAAYDYLFSDPEGDGTTIAEETNLHVVNMSLGSYLEDDDIDLAFEAVIAAAEEKGVMTVASGGNGDSSGARTDVHYPSDFDEVVAVTALADDSSYASFSDYNEHKNLAAPGESIYSTWYAGERSYYYADGTSMASPVVAGCAALLWAYDPYLSVAQAKRALYGTATKLSAGDFDPHYGWGKVNPAAALESLGTVHVLAEADDMPVTTAQQLTPVVLAASGFSAEADHEWEWSTSDRGVATVAADGTLTARGTGTATVWVRASDEPQLAGSATVTISDIAVPGEVTAASGLREDVVNVRWQPAAGAARYDVYRAQGASYFSLAGSVPAAEAADGDACRYVDKQVRGGVSYSYYVVPVGTLDGQDVDGLESARATVTFCSRTGLRALVDEANGLMRDTHRAEGGEGIDASEQWAPPAAFEALEGAVSDALDVYAAPYATQAQVDAQSAALADALEAFRAASAPGDVKPADPDPQPAPSSGGAAKPGDGEGAGAGSGTGAGGQGGSGAKPDGPGTGSDSSDGKPGGSGSGSDGGSRSGSGGSAAPGNADDKGSAPGDAGTAAPADGAAPASGGSSAPDAPDSPDAQAAITRAMYRLYNPNSGEHFYTASVQERDQLIDVGWEYEGLGWMAPESGASPVYRLYNPNAGDHHYTTSASERDDLTAVGWIDEGVGWNSAEGPDAKPLYRLYNPNVQAGSHHYTTSADERDFLVGAGWQDEGVGWYGA